MVKRDDAGFTKTAAHITFALFVILISALSSLAQRPEGGTGVPHSPEEIRARQQEMIERESILNASKQPAPKRLSEREQKLILKQIKEDYEGIQSARNALVRMVSAAASGNLDYKLIAESASEINKRAARLREILALPLLNPKEKELEKAQDTKPNVLLDEWTKITILQLGNHIKSFVTNPHFQNPAVINADQTTRASRDLEMIIEISKRLKEAAKKR